MLGFLSLTDAQAVGVGIGAILVYLLIACAVEIVCGAIASNIAGKKGRSRVGYFFLGFFFCLLGIIVALVVSDQSVPERKRRVVYEADDDEDYE